ncbi:MAG: hypothetical protein HY532_00385 [Chloroflexi bacterium]|nr:hypothetical protein [Chloroflexota bacterium]
MNDTALNHLIGCGSDALANPNQLTLVDAGKMYEAVANGFLVSPTRDTAYDIMIDGRGSGTSDMNAQAIVNAIITDEAVGLGLSDATLDAFRDDVNFAFKAGGYTLSSKEYRSLAGWALLAAKDGGCAPVEREYVFGAFINAADSIAPDDIWTFTLELLREQIRDGLESLAACEADVQITSIIVVDPPAEIGVNTPTVLTVRVAMRNNGPADPVDAVLTRATIVPSDCDITPTGSVTPVPAMPKGSAVVQEMDFTVDCSQPSFHLFRFDSEIALANPAMVDPDLSNNTGIAQTTIPVIARADLAIMGWDFSALDIAGIQDLLVGQDFFFSTTKVLHNFGDTVDGLYHEAVDAGVSRIVVVPEGIKGLVRIGADEAPARIVIQKSGDPDIVLNNQPSGATVEAEGPATITVEFSALSLAISVDRVVMEEFGIHCLAPGLYDFAFVNTIAAEDEHVVDPDLSNNTVEVLRIVECITPVQINIRPGNAHNFINPTSNTTVPVAILTTEEGEYGLPLAFGATTIDHTSARFGTVDTLNAGGGTAPAPSTEFIRDTHEMEDKTKDGDLDMVLLFAVPGSGIQPETTEACVVGTYTGEGGAMYKFFGCDVVATKP